MIVNVRLDLDEGTLKRISGTNKPATRKQVCTFVNEAIEKHGTGIDDGEGMSDLFSPAAARLPDGQTMDVQLSDMAPETVSRPAGGLLRLVFHLNNALFAVVNAGRWADREGRKATAAQLNVMQDDLEALRGRMAGHHDKKVVNVG